MMFVFFWSTNGMLVMMKITREPICIFALTNDQPSIHIEMSSLIRVLSSGYEAEQKILLKIVLKQCTIWTWFFFSRRWWGPLIRLLRKEDHSELHCRDSNRKSEVMNRLVVFVDEQISFITQVKSSSVRRTRKIQMNGCTTLNSLWTSFSRAVKRLDDSSKNIE